jgi:hypothetical protein
LHWYFWDRLSQTICMGWLWTTVLLISASWVARVTGVSHWCLAMKLSTFPCAYYISSSEKCLFKSLFFHWIIGLYVVKLYCIFSG